MFACLHAESGNLFELASSFSPVVEQTAPDTVVFSITGLGRLIGSTHQVASEICRCGVRMGIRANLGIASNPDTAELIARNKPGVTIVPTGQEAEYLGQLPLVSLNAAAVLLEACERWGIRTLAELAALPEMGLAERFGAEGVRLRRLALGQMGRTLRLPAVEHQFQKRMELEHPLELLEPLLFLISSILQELLEEMRNLSLAANRVDLVLELQDGSRHERGLELAAPMVDAAGLLKILQLDLETHSPSAPITVLRIELKAVPPQTVQHGLFLPAQPEPQKLQLVLARVAGLVGEQNVGSPRLLNTHRPDAFEMRAFRPTASVGKPGDLPQKVTVAFRMFRPALAARVRTKEERPAEVAAVGVRGMVRTASGPWRGSGEWWTQTRWARDEWDIDLSDGGVYRLYCRLDSRAWFVEGVYD